MATMNELIEAAVAGGITREQIEALQAAYPVMREESWWRDNAAGNPVRAVRHRLEKLSRDAFTARASAWTDDELRAVAREHRAGRPVDDERLAEACRRGFISQSAAMNSDF